jgi:hypothetical protein
MITGKVSKRERIQNGADPSLFSMRTLVIPNLPTGPSRDSDATGGATAEPRVLGMEVRVLVIGHNSNALII